MNLTICVWIALRSRNKQENFLFSERIWRVFIVFRVKWGALILSVQSAFIFRNIAFLNWCYTVDRLGYALQRNVNKGNTMKIWEDVIHLLSTTGLFNAAPIGQLESFNLSCLLYTSDAADE